jgi:iron(III) transport system substrate-binding protein
VTVNGDMIDASAIETWDDLLDPEYKGKIIAYDPRSNGPGQGAVGAMALALDYPYLEKLFTEQEVTFVADNDQLAQAVARGDQPIALALIQQQIEKFVAEGINLEVVLPEPMPGYLTPGFGVVRQAKGAPHPAAAQVFLNWYASTNGQQAYQDVMLESSNRLDVDKSKLPDYTVPQEGVEYLNDGLSEDYYVTDRKVVIEQVTELIGGR